MSVILYKQVTSSSEYNNMYSHCLCSLCSICDTCFISEINLQSRKALMSHEKTKRESILYIYKIVIKANKT